MLNSKHILTFAALSTLVACAIPEPGKKEITQKVAGPQLELSESQQSTKVLSEEYDSEISISIGKKLQLSVCLKSSDPSKSIVAGDSVVLNGTSETRTLKADAAGCVQWQESVSATEGTELKKMDIRRNFEMKEKFSNTLDVVVSTNFETDETSVTTADKAPTTPPEGKMTLDKAKIAKEYDLGFEALALSVTKKSDGTRSLSLQGSPTLGGEVLRYARLQGQLVLSVSTDGKTQTVLKTLKVKGGVREGSLALKIEDNQFKCDQGQISLKIQLSALSKRHSVKPLEETHVLKSCAELEGNIELNDPLK